MLSDEEKKAIETIKDFKNLKWYEHAFDNGTEVLDEEQKQDITTILNLIEKQSKELKANKGYHLGFIDGGIAKRYEYEDKIKAKIKELEKIIEFEKPTYEDVLKYAIEVLQSLLEKE